MLKLMIFEFRRIAKSIFFWIVAAYSFIWPVLTALFYRAIMSLDLSEGIKFVSIHLSDDEIKYLTWFIAVAFMTELPKFTALFTCLHLGRDYTDGIVRNKIIAGHSRFAIFNSYIITQLAATVVLCVIYILSAMFGLAVSGIGVNVNRGEMFGRYAVAIIVFSVMTVTFSVLALIFRKRALPVILCILIAMGSNAAASVVGYFNTPSKACDDYLEMRHEYFETLEDAGVVDSKTVKDLEEKYGRDHFLNVGWKIFHPIYVVSPFGFEGDYGAVGATNMFLGGSAEYTEEIDFSQGFYYNDPSLYEIMDSFSVDADTWEKIDPDKLYLMEKDFNKIDSLHLEYSTLNWIYIGKALAWMGVIYAYGYFVFRRKNLF